MQAEVGVLVVNVTNPQVYEHALMAQTFGLKSIVVAVTQMDLV